MFGARFFSMMALVGLDICPAHAKAGESEARSPICRVTLRAHSEVDGPRVHLRDIAEVDCPGDTSLPSADLGAAAGFGLTRLIDVERLQAGPLSPWNHAMVLVVPRPTLQVTTLCDTLSETELSLMLDSLYRNEPLSPGMRRTVKLPVSASAITLPKGRKDMELRFVGLKRRGKVPLELRIGRNGQWARRVSVVADVRVLAQVTVALASIRKGEKFHAGQLGEEVRDITAFSTGHLPKKPECIGKIAAVSLMPGRVITQKLIDSPPLIRRGDLVPMVLESGMVKVIIDAVARRDGRIGDIIPLWNPASKKMARGEILSDGRLRLLAEGS